MKKCLAMLLSVMLIAGLATGCGAKSEEAATAETTKETTEAATEETTDAEATVAESADKAATEIIKTINGKELTKIGFSAPAMDNEFMTNLDASLKETAAQYGIEVITSEAEQSTSKQVEQIENMVTMGCQAICVSPVDLDGILDTLKSAKQAGVVISLCGVIPESKDYYDVVANVEQTDLGQSAAKAAAAWIDKTFPDAADGSIEVAILALDNSTEAIKRDDALKTVEQLTKKAKIVEVYDSTGAQSVPTKAQEYTEMMLISHPNVKCILAYSDFMGLPADEVIMRTPNINKDQFGIFACDYSEAGCEAIAKSVNGESTYRGSGAFGVTFGKTMFDTVVGNVQVDDKGVYYEPAFEINPDNVANYLK